jgi:hypothetical protein
VARAGSLKSFGRRRPSEIDKTAPEPGSGLSVFLNLMTKEGAGGDCWQRLAQVFISLDSMEFEDAPLAACFCRRPRICFRELSGFVAMFSAVYFRKHPAANEALDAFCDWLARKKLFGIEPPFSLSDIDGSNAFCVVVGYY